LSFSAALLAASAAAACFPGPSPNAGIAALSAARGEAPRPVLSGPEETLASADGDFVVHWTMEGEDRPDPAGDEDGSGVPDYPERLLEGLLLARDQYLALGWRPILPDAGAAGSDAVDVYVHAIEANGYAYLVPVDADPGASCFIEIDPELGDLGDVGLESVAAHELHHCVQFGYSGASASWIYEATATFAQYGVYSDPLLQAALDVLWNIRLRGMDQPIDSVGNRFEYAGFLLLKFWEEYPEGSADPAAGPALWERLALLPDWREALDAEAEARWDQGLDRSFLDFAAWNRFACSRDDGAHYDPLRYPCELPAVSVDVEEVAPGSALLFAVHEDATHTALYFDLPADGDERPVELRCDPVDAGSADGSEARVRLIAVDAYGKAGEEADATGRDAESFTLRLDGEIDPAGSVAIVAASTGETAAASECTIQRVDAVEPPPDAADPEGEGCACAAATAPSLAGAGWPAAGGLLAALGLRRRGSGRGRGPAPTASPALSPRPLRRTSPGSGACSPRP
jgi:hypothetical protein